MELFIRAGKINKIPTVETAGEQLFKNPKVRNKYKLIKLILCQQTHN